MATTHNLRVTYVFDKDLKPSAKSNLTKYRDVTQFDFVKELDEELRMAEVIIYQGRVIKSRF